MDFISDSEFSMWRAVFAFAYADNGLSMEEQGLLNSYLSKANFSERQRDILKEDLADPPDIEEMYRRITRPNDKERFCVLARALAWCEGDLDEQERKILKKVSCFKGGEENDILLKSRASSHLHDFYQHYAKSGVAGLLPYPRQLEIIT